MANGKFNWHRLEPRPHSDTIEENLAARVRDPLWFLARQWQFGEFNGEDAASPAYIDLKARFSSIDGWKPTDDEDFQNYDKNKAPLEAKFTVEPFTPDWATRVELGQRFEALLKKEELKESEDIINSLRDKYGVPISENTDKAEHDWELQRFLMLCGGRAINGVKLYQDARDNLSRFLNDFSVPRNRDPLCKVLKAFFKWISSVYGDFEEENSQNFSIDDPIAWRPEQLEYKGEISASINNRRHPKRVQLNAYPERDGTFDWYTFDQKTTLQEIAKTEPPKSVSVLPGYVRFSGMPNKRWWKFENRKVHFPSIKPDVVESAKIILIDFMLVYSNDWFVVPFTQEVGTICQIDELEVYDVFGGHTPICRAEGIDCKTMGEEQYTALKPSERWSMFSLTDEGGLEFADFFIMPPSAGATSLTSKPLEEISFIRDEMANMVWAIEHTTENGIGLPWSGNERHLAKQRDNAEEVISDHGAPLKYRIQTTVPEHWIPFLPVGIRENQPDIALERAAMLDVDQRHIPPLGRILNPMRLDSDIHTWEKSPSGQKVYRIREEEVPRAGINVSRVIRFSRWIDGSSHLWIAREKAIGRGEGRAGLQFDIAVPTQQ